MVDLGAFVHRVALERPEVVRSATGAEQRTWASAAMLWAAIEPLAGREAVLASQQAAVAQTRITVVWAPVIDQVDERWRIRHLATLYGIVSIGHKQLAQGEVEFLCESGVKES